MSDEKSPAEKLIDDLGGPMKAAAALGIPNPSVVYNWRTRKQVPADMVLTAEAVSGLSRHYLRPDVFGPAPAQETAA